MEQGWGESHVFICATIMMEAEAGVGVSGIDSGILQSHSSDYVSAQII